MYLAGLLENPPLSGVNLNGPLCFLLFSGQKQDSWAVGFSISNPDSYLRALSRSLTLLTRDREERTYVYSKQELPDKNGSQPREKQICLILRENYAWLSHSPLLIASLKNSTLTDFSGPAPANLSLVFQSEPFLQFIEDQSEHKPGRGLAGKIFKTYLSSFHHYARQIRRIILNINIDEKGIFLEKLVEAEPGSGLGEFLREQEKGNLTLARYLNPDAGLIVAGRIWKPEMLLRPAIKLFARFGPAFDQFGGEEAENPFDSKFFQEASRNWISSYCKAVGEEIAFSISSHSPSSLFPLVILQDVSDEVEYRSFIKHFFIAWRALTDRGGKMGISPEADDQGKIRKYRGAEIHTLKIKPEREKLPEKADLMSEGENLFEPRTAGPVIIEIALRKGLGMIMIDRGENENIDSWLDLVIKDESAFDLKRLSDCRRGVNAAICFSGGSYLSQLSRRLRFPGDTGPLRPDKFDFQMEGRADLPLLACIRVEGETMKVSIRIPIEEIAVLKKLLEEGPAPAAKPGL